MNVRVERYIEQVQEGRIYKGYIEINKVRFYFRLELAVSIYNLDDIDPVNGFSQSSRICLLTLTRNGQRINLDDDEFDFFLSIILEFASEFYHHNMNQRLLDMAPRGLQSISDVSVGIRISGTCDLPLKYCLMLNNDKFSRPTLGCVEETLD